MKAGLSQLSSHRVDSDCHFSSESMVLTSFELVPCLGGDSLALTFEPLLLIKAGE